MLSLQQELEALREERSREKDIAARRQRQDEEEIQDLRDRCERLEASGGGGSVCSPRDAPAVHVLMHPFPGGL